MATESNTPADATTTPATTEEYDPALLESVKKQVEYYFSKENLSQDPFLQSQMDAQMSVPISVIMKFSKMKQLTSDENVVRRALQDSSVTIVNNRIKANIKASTRSTIILRDVPADTTEEEIREVFNYEGARPIVSLRSDIGGTWFVNFEGEEDAKTSLLDLRMKKRTLKGESVKARIKTEQVVRSFFPVNVVPPPAPIIGIPPGGFPCVPFLPPNPEMMPFGYVVPPIDPTMLMESFALAAGANLAAGAAAPADASVDGTAVSPATAAASDKKTASGKTATSSSTTSSSTATGARKTGGASSSTASNSNNNNSGRSGKDGKASSTSTSSNNRNNNNSNSNSNTKNSSSSNNARHSNKNETGAASGTSSSSSTSAAPGSAAAMLKQPAVELNNVNFPPLFHASEDALHNTPIPQVGYPASEEYVKYTIDDVIMIVKSNVQDATLPAEVNASAHPLAMQSEVNLDLLKRQRTFTIDETREQLRQGRPVTSGLLFESVDYRSLHYGDSDSNPTTSTQSNHAATASFQQQLSTIEEAKNETSMLLNMSTDSVLAHDLSQMDMSFSMETQSHTMQSPARMNASSWAAMVKSAADVASSNVHLVPAAVTITTTTTVTTSISVQQQQQQTANHSKKTSSNNNTSNNNNNDKKKKSNNAAGSSSSVNEKKNEKKSSANDKSNKNNNNASSSANKQGGGRSKNNSSSANHAEDKQQEDGEHAAAGATAAWGGKSSFASVLKTKAEEDAAVAAASAATTTSNTTRRPATSTSANKPTSSSNNSNASSQRNNNNNNKKQSNSNNNIQESGGMWAKETLPPLKKNNNA